MGFCHKNEISFSSSSSSSFTSQPTHQPSSPSKQYYESTKQESDYKQYFSDYKKAPPRENADDLRKQLHEVFFFVQYFLKRNNLIF